MNTNYTLFHNMQYSYISMLRACWHKLSNLRVLTIIYPAWSHIVSGLGKMVMRKNINAWAMRQYGILLRPHALRQCITLLFNIEGKNRTCTKRFALIEEALPLLQFTEKFC